MTPPAWLHFFQRIYPSANMVLVRGSRPVLVDTGFGSDLPLTEQLLRAADVAPERLHLIINTHYHCDHIGGNSALQQRYHLPIAAHRWDAALINQRDAEACSATWLDQPIEPYQIDRPLAEGDEIDSGETVLQVLHTPGHTLGHISLYAPRERVLICGDAVHGDDVAWIGVFREGAGALQRALETLDRLAKLPLQWACSGHGAPMHQPLTSIDQARRRYEKWLGDPEKLGWHACKRIFTYQVMIRGGLRESELTASLLRQPWFLDYTRYVFRCDPASFIAPLVREVIRVGAAGWQDGRLVSLTPFTPPPPQWVPAYSHPSEWPAVSPGQIS
jgi:hydroxyacylglutathione hydrolase